MSKKTQVQKEPSVSKKVILEMLKVAAKEKPVLFVPYVLFLLRDLMQKLQTVIIPKFLIDELVALYNGEDINVHIKKAAFFVIITLALMFVSGLFGQIANRVKSNCHNWLTMNFEVKILDHIMKIDYEHTENPLVLDQLNKAKDGIDWYSQNVCGILDQLSAIINNVIVMVGIITVVAISSPLVIPIQIVSIGLSTIFNYRINKIQIKGFHNMSKTNRGFSYVFWDMCDVTYGKDIRLYNSTKLFDEREQKYLDKQIDIWKEQADGTKKQQYNVNIISALSSGVLYYYIGKKALAKIVSIGDFTMLVSAASTLSASFESIVKAVLEIKKRAVYINQYFVLMDYPVMLKKGNVLVDTNKQHVIEFKNVSFKYPRTDKLILENVNITIPCGEHLAVVGLNGAGKTTFVKLLCRLYDVTSGEILIDGVNIKDYSEEEYRKLFAVVFQDFSLFAFSLKENITFNEDTPQEQIDEVLKQSGLYDDVQKMPLKEMTCLSKQFDKDNGLDLSGGQRQKAAISRALYKNAPIVILDEPTAALDPIAEADVYSRFNTTLAGGKTAIYISHRLSSCKFCDKIAVFSDKSIAEYGSHAQLMKIKDGIYRNMFETQAKQYR